MGCQWVNLYQDWNIQVMTAICMAESRGNYLATDYDSNGTIDRGLLEINSIHLDMVDGNAQSLFNPDVNVAVAHRLYLLHGYKPWVSYDNGSYRQFLL